MNSKQIETPNGRFIKVYNDLFTFAERTEFYEFSKCSVYKSTGGDSHKITTPQIFSNFSVDDVKTMGFFNTNGYKLLDKENNLSKKDVIQYRVNLSPPFEINNLHVDYSSLTLLYYLNMDWNIEYGGHTIFMDDEIKEPIFISLFEPGKLILFDGNIPHMILSPSSNKLDHRRSFAIQYK